VRQRWRRRVCGVGVVSCGHSGHSRWARKVSFDAVVFAMNIHCVSLIAAPRTTAVTADEGFLCGARGKMKERLYLVAYQQPPLGPESSAYRSSRNFGVLWNPKAQYRVHSSPPLTVEPRLSEHRLTETPVRRCDSQNCLPRDTSEPLLVRWL
jgi:hypothetical protein